MAVIGILVFNLESYEYFGPVFVEVLCHSLMRFAKVIFFPYEIVREDLLAWKVYYRFYFFILTQVPLDE